MVIVVTGASSGIGLACARHLCQLGHTVYGASRSIAGITGEDFHRVTMDVCDDDSVRTGMERVLDGEGRVDAVVNAAGFGIAGPVELTAIDEVRAQFDTNFFGVVRVCQAVLPHMRERGSGRIVNIGSIGGRIAIPYQAFYSATKFALEGYTEALRIEVKRFGIHVTVVEPGDFNTGFTGSRIRSRDSRSASPYADPFEHALQTMEQDERSGPDPIDVARRVGRILTRRKPRLRYTAGRTSQRLAVVIKRALPDSVYERLVSAYYGLD